MQLPSPRILALLAATGSALILAGAFAFQHLGGLPPCKLCLWQRWPHAAAIVIGLLILVLKRMELAALGLLAALTTAAIGFYHLGVEHKLWEGPASCTGGQGTEGISASDLLDQILAAPIVRCDDILWEFAGLSMAGWNGVLSLILAGLWALSLRRT